MYQHAFNPTHPAGPDSTAAQILGWAQQASLPVGCLSEPAVLRSALEALTYQLDGSRAAANTIIRKRAVLHGALSYAAEAGLLPDNPLDTIAWQVPRSSAAIDPVVVASPAQASALLDAVNRTRPENHADRRPPQHPDRQRLASSGQILEQWPTIRRGPQLAHGRSANRSQWHEKAGAIIR